MVTHNANNPTLTHLEIYLHGSWNTWFITCRFCCYIFSESLRAQPSEGNFQNVQFTTWNSGQNILPSQSRLQYKHRKLVRGTNFSKMFQLMFTSFISFFTFYGKKNICHPLMCIINAFVFKSQIQTQCQSPKTRPAPLTIVAFRFNSQEWLAQKQVNRIQFLKCQGAKHAGKNIIQELVLLTSLSSKEWVLSLDFCGEVESTTTTHRSSHRDIMWFGANTTAGFYQQFNVTL